MIRIPGPGRIENRTVDGAANPYLAPAVMLAAGLDGVEKKLPAGKRNDKNLYEVSIEDLQAEGIEFLPTTLNEALDELEKDDVTMEALGREYAEYYVGVKRDEWKRYHNSVSQWKTVTIRDSTKEEPSRHKEEGHSLPYFRCCTCTRLTVCGLYPQEYREQSDRSCLRGDESATRAGDSCRSVARENSHGSHPARVSPTAPSRWVLTQKVRRIARNPFERATTDRAVTTHQSIG